MNSDTTKARIFTAARALFDREGEAGISMRRIADSIGITPMAIYRHYANKEALLNALMLDGMAAWEARAGAIKAVKPLHWLAQLGEAFLAFALNEPRRFEAAFLLKAGAARRYPDDFAQGRSPVLSMAHAQIERAKEDGLSWTASAVEIGLAFSALAQGLVSMYRAGRFAGEREFCAAYRQAMRHCVRSFVKEPAG